MSKLHIKKGDTVCVLAGKDKGKTGVVSRVIVDKQRAVVEGLNKVQKSQKPSAQNPQGASSPLKLLSMFLTSTSSIPKPASPHV